jgi:hypothetical protein
MHLNTSQSCLLPILFHSFCTAPSALIASQHPIPGMQSNPCCCCGEHQLYPGYPAPPPSAHTWQSNRSVTPPWPGMESPKSLILKPRLKPLAKKPPKGAASEANTASATWGRRHDQRRVRQAEVRAHPAGQTQCRHRQYMCGRRQGGRRRRQACVVRSVHRGGGAIGEESTTSAARGLQASGKRWAGMGGCMGRQGRQG